MTLLHIAYLHGMGRIYTRLPADTAGSRKECHLVPFIGRSACEVLLGRATTWRSRPASPHAHCATTPALAG